MLYSAYGCGNSESPIRKTSLPTLWIDTSAGIKLAKISLGELQEIEVQRLERLRKLVYELVQNGKLLCPESDQREEYEAERLEAKVAAEFTKLSKGVRLVHRAGVLSGQIHCAMGAYRNARSRIDLPVSIYFHSDPVKELAEARQTGFVFSIRIASPPELLARQAAAKALMLDHVEKLRQEYVAAGRSYEEHYASEQTEHIDIAIRMLEEFCAKLQRGIFDFWDYMGVEEYLVHLGLWNKLGGQPPGLQGLREFLRSDYCGNLPTWKIRSQLYADLLTGNQPIEPGDSMDVELLSVAIPVAHYVLTDKKMEKRIKRRGMDQEWGTQVFSMSTSDGLFCELERLA